MSRLGYFFTLSCLSEKKLRLQVINKDIKPFQKEFYNSFNLTNLPRGNLQLNGGGLPGGQLALGAIVRGQLVQGAITRVVIVSGQVAWGLIVRGDLSWGLLVGGSCPGWSCPKACKHLLKKIC